MSFVMVIVWVMTRRIVVKMGIQESYLPILIPPSWGAVMIIGAVLSVGASALRPPVVPTKTKRSGGSLGSRVLK